ncbi:MAG: gliding motility-associated C-terminal domain-containing protein [Bacteroidales bacterium]|nr:gliding motility-associated C-terminal domain-containing protein [Bacteroidales bacterium]
MKKTLLIIIMLMTLAGGAWAQYVTSINLYVSKHEVCLGDVVTFQDNTIRDNVIVRQWTFSDTVIRGNAIGEQLTIYRQLTQDTSPVMLMLVRNLPDTLINDIIDTNISVHIDTIINGPADTTFTTRRDTAIHITRDSVPIWYNDTLYAYDTVRVFLPKKMHATGDSIACPGDSVNIKMEPVINGVSYSWFTQPYDNGSPLAYGSRLKTEPYSRSALYFLKMQNPNGCVMWDSVRVYIMQNTLTVDPADGNICTGKAAILTAGKADHYEWQSMPADTTLDSMNYMAQIAVYPTATTIYACTPFGTNGCRGEVQYITITPYAVPVQKVELSPRFIDPEDPVMHLTDLSENTVSSFWNFGLSDYADGQSIEHRFTDLRYDSTEITLRSTNAIGCSTDTAFRVPVQRFASWAPNTFTPNRSENNTFRIRTINEVEYFSIHIYTREGKEIFRSIDPQFIWDGTHKGKDCPQGVYVYICKYRRAGTGDVTQMKGLITLLR